MFIIGDVHGCYNTLMNLMEKIYAVSMPNEKIIFTGDLIDRGGKVKEVVDFVKDNGYISVKGNHEDLCVGANYNCAFPGGYDNYYRIWMNNGGMKTKDSIGTLADMKDNGYIDYFNNMPLTYIDKDVKINGKPIVVSHSFIFSCASMKDDFNIMWNRDFYINDKIWGINPNYFNIFGHTPIEYPVIKDCYAMIDTGCVFKKNLTAIRIFNGMYDSDIEIITSKYIED